MKLPIVAVAYKVKEIVYKETDHPWIATAEAVDDFTLHKEIKKLHATGLSIRKIAKTLKITKGKVKWLLKRKPAQLKKAATPRE